MRRLAPFFFATLFALAGLSCMRAPGPPIAMRVSWGLDSPAAMIPASVSQLTLLVYIGTATDPQMSINTVMGLTDVDMTGHADLVRGDLPIGMPIRMTILGQNAAGATQYVGHAGPFTLVAGERRYVEMRMYAVGGYSTLTPSAIELPPRLLATTTSLSDGRVLVSGGFTRAMRLTTCPASPAGSTCYDLTAAADAYIFDVASGRFLPVRGGLRQARGGHTATLLPGDRVLVAGGAAHALLVLTPQPPMPPMPPTFAVSLRSLDTTVPAATSFEVFLPDANAATVDVNRDGNPGRGGFVGAAEDPSVLGRLDAPRFLHAAAAVPGRPTQVLLVGGIDSPNSWVVYDDARAGGYGVLLAPSAPPMNQLLVARPAPSIVPLRGAMGDALWIVGGGGPVTSNADLVEVWTSTAAAPSGMTRPPTGMTFASTMTNHADWALTRPTAIPLDATHALILGWYGPLCDAIGAPSFTGTTLCDAGTAPRSFTIDGMTGAAFPTTAHMCSPNNTRNCHAFAAGVRMSDGSALVTGGISALTAVPNNTTDQFSAMVLAGSAQNTALQPMMMQARLLHSVAALDDQGALVLGGITITGDVVTVVSAPEVLYLPRP